MNRQIGRWVLLIAFLFVSVYFWKSRTHNESRPEPDFEEIEDVSQDDSTAVPSGTVSAEGSFVATGGNTVANGVEGIPIPPAIYDNWFQDLRSCITIFKDAPDPSQDWNPRLLEATLQTTLAIENELKSQTYLVLTTGGFREITTENKIQDDGFTAPVLSVFDTVDGQKKEIEISDEQKTEPAESLLASFQSDGKIFGIQKYKNYYYENGLEVTAHLWDERLSQVNFKFNGKQLECNNLACKCTTLQP